MRVRFGRKTDAAIFIVALVFFIGTIDWGMDRMDWRYPWQPTYTSPAPEYRSTMRSYADVRMPGQLLGLIEYPELVEQPLGRPGEGLG